MRGFLQRFMIGRYGQDLLNRDLMFLALALYIIGIFAGIWLSTLAMVIMFVVIFRMLSRNTSRRLAELQSYEQLRSRVMGYFSGRINRIKQSKTYRFYKCPTCHQTLRVPRGKGKLLVKCPKCGESFTKKT